MYIKFMYIITCDMCIYLCQTCMFKFMIIMCVVSFSPIPNARIKPIPIHGFFTSESLRQENLSLNLRKLTFESIICCWAEAYSSGLGRGEDCRFLQAGSSRIKMGMCKNGAPPKCNHQNRMCSIKMMEYYYNLGVCTTFNQAYINRPCQKRSALSWQQSLKGANSSRPTILHLLQSMESGRADGDYLPSVIMLLLFLFIP